MTQGGTFLSMDIFVFLLGVTVLPILVNKTTERGRFDFVHPYLRHLWTLLLIIFTYYVLDKPEVKNLIAKFPRAGWSYVLAFIVGGILLCFYWWATGWLLRETGAGKVVNDQSNSDFTGRLAALLNEGDRISDQCQRVPNAYQSPAANWPVITDAIFNWQQRVETVLGVDSDNYTVRMWRNATLMAPPDSHDKIATLCTLLSVKRDILSRIIQRKKATKIQLESRLQGLIDDGESLEAFSVESRDERAIADRAGSWNIDVNRWLGDYMDDSYQSQFNKAQPSASKPSSIPHTPKGILVWQATEGRLMALRRFHREIRTGS